MKTYLCKDGFMGTELRARQIIHVKDVYLNFNNKWKKYVSERLST